MTRQALAARRAKREEILKKIASEIEEYPAATSVFLEAYDIVPNNVDAFGCTDTLLVAIDEYHSSIIFAT